MLPLPFLKYIPKLFQSDSKTVNLATKVDTHLTTWRKDIIDIRRLVRSDECPAKYLIELDFLLSAGIKDLDSELTRRKKIRDAIETHKNLGLWKTDVKIKLDNITGYSAALIKAIGTDDWILVGDGTTPSTSYWATMGADGIDDDLGLALLGEGTEIEVQGNIYVDMHEGINTGVLTQAQIDQAVNEIKDDSVPAYFIVYLGYLDVSGIFVQYPGGIIS